MATKRRRRMTKRRSPVKRRSFRTRRTRRRSQSPKSKRGMRRICFWAKTKKRGTVRKRRAASLKLGKPYDYVPNNEDFRY